MTLVINPQNFMELYALYRYNQPCNNYKQNIKRYTPPQRQNSKRKDIRCGGIIITGLKIKINEKNPRIKINDTYYYIIVMNEDISLVPKDKREIAEVKWEKIENMNQINTNRGLRKLDSVYPKIIKLARKKMNENVRSII